MYYSDCQMCNGTGYRPEYNGVYAGVCFYCNHGKVGTKTHPDVLKKNRERYAAKKAAQHEAEAEARKVHAQKRLWEVFAITFDKGLKNHIERQAAEDIVSGKQVITGEVISAKWKESQYGQSFKMLVKDERGFKVWGTVPTKIMDSVVGEGNPISGDDMKGVKVTFTATVTASYDDAQFGFYSRPTKAAIYQAL